MDQRHGEALSAFFDGERVDPELLAESLAQPGASALLAEFAAMRAEVLRDPSRPTPAFYERMASVLREPRLRRFWGNRHARRALAASLLAAAGIGGFLLGSDSARQPSIVSEGAPRLSTTADQDAVRSQPQASQLPPSAAGSPVALGTPLRGDPPVASLRLRFAQWRDLPTLAVAEGERQ